MAKKRICYYISDHGLGHTTRSIAIIKIILDSMKSDVEFYVKGDSGYKMLKDTFRQNKNVKVIKCKNDIGVNCTENHLGVDRSSTKCNILNWFLTWNDYIKREKIFIKKNT